MIVACHLYSVWIRYQYVYHLHYCSKDHHHYSSCCHCCYFRGDCFCGCYALILAFPFYPSYVIVLMSPLFCSCFPSPIPLLLPFFIAFNLLFSLFTYSSFTLVFGLSFALFCVFFFFFAPFS